jgi:hypothetical protein
LEASWCCGVAVVRCCSRKMVLRCCGLAVLRLRLEVRGQRLEGRGERREGKGKAEVEVEVEGQMPMDWLTRASGLSARGNTSMPILWQLSS